MASATPSTPPAPYANVTAVNTSGPPPPNLPSEADVELDESFAANPGRLFGAYVTYSSSLSMLQDNIIVGIRDTITEQKSKFSNEGSYPCEFKGGTAQRRDVHRILVAFTEEVDHQAFKEIRHVVFKDDRGGLLHAQIGQGRISYKEILGSDRKEKGPQKVFIVLKKMPDSWTLKQTEAAFTSYTWKSKGAEHPYLAKFTKLTWFWHKSGVQRRMLIAEVIPHEDDPSCDKVPSIFNPKPGKMAPYIIGCSLHECKLCGQMGHRADVHDSFKGMPGLKRKGSGQTQDNAEGSGKRPKTELMGEIEQDTYIEYVDSGTSRKAWKCTLCKKAGNGFFRCYRHVKGAEHTEALAELEAGRTAAEEVEKKEAAAKDAAASEKMEQDGVAAIADTW